MNLRVIAAGLAAALLLPTLAHAQTPPEKPAEKGFKPSAAYAWLEVALEATARDVDRKGARPTIISREVHIVVTAMYDAWAAYDAKAVGTRLGGKLRRPAPEHTDANKSIAIGTAVCRALLYVYPEDR